jgi:hypothetical protein
MANRKVSLKEIQKQMKGRGRDKFSDPELEKDLKGLKVGEAIVWEQAKVDTTKTQKVQNREKAKHRNRAVSVGESAGVEISVGWTEEGEMVITLKQASA